MYRAAAEALGVRIEDLLHVDDHVDNVQGALGAGARGVLWGSEVECLEDLEAIVGR
jgi:HAD superfamily hydrolase (TIGR01509 family)